MSAELRVLRDPGGTFRELLESSGDGAWRLLRRPLLLMFSMGVALSLSSSNRLSARTTIDGMISFAFLPAAEIVAAAVVYARSDRRLPFARVIDAFFVSNSPWLLWTLLFCTWETLTHALTISLTGATVALSTLAVPLVWAAYLDLQLVRIVLSRRSVAGEIVAARTIGWTIGICYFVGIALWAQIVAWLT